MTRVSISVFFVLLLFSTTSFGRIDGFLQQRLALTIATNPKAVLATAEIPPFASTTTIRSIASMKAIGRSVPRNTVMAFTQGFSPAETTFYLMALVRHQELPTDHEKATIVRAFVGERSALAKQFEESQLIGRVVSTNVEGPLPGNTNYIQVRHLGNPVWGQTVRDQAILHTLVSDRPFDSTKLVREDLDSLPPFVRGRLNVPPFRQELARYPESSRKALLPTVSDIREALSALSDRTLTVIATLIFLPRYSFDTYYVGDPRVIEEVARSVRGINQQAQAIIALLAAYQAAVQQYALRTQSGQLVPNNTLQPRTFHILYEYGEALIQAASTYGLDANDKQLSGARQLTRILLVWSSYR